MGSVRGRFSPSCPFVNYLFTFSLVLLGLVRVIVILTVSTQLLLSTAFSKSCKAFFNFFTSFSPPFLYLYYTIYVHICQEFLESFLKKSEVFYEIFIKSFLNLLNLLTPSIELSILSKSDA